MARSMTGWKTGASLAALLLAAACSEGGLDLDLRTPASGDTSAAAQRAVAPRPLPDNRGVISYPTYQVVVANPGETVGDVGTRLGIDGGELARYNGLPVNVALRGGEAIVLPVRVAEPSPATGAIATGPILPAGEVDVTGLAGAAIDRAEAPSGAQVLAPTGREPQRHRVSDGETAYSIARAYDVPVASLADWNGLGPDLAVREGQFLLIPPAPTRVAALEPEVARPGERSAAPVPPSAAKPLPQARPQDTARVETPPAPALEDTRTAASDTTKLRLPVQGRIARGYEKGTSDGVGFSAAAGSEVVAADAGTVAAITRDTDQVPIIVVRHAGNLLTVYAGVENVAVEKGDSVARGQKLGTVREGDPAMLHFEVREGFESVDPMPYIS
ncbi:MAG: peptidoglycan DD-metalloendopeptidase family protein [Paracoccaceae bacterium]|nr:peptidoglycan DD-metalloendopeptidase family protein [Paracoccaceae bacterium]